MSVGNRIKDMRQSRGISRQEFAKRLDITVSAVSNYENGISFPKEPILIKIMDELQCDANYIFQDVIHNQEASSLTHDEQALLDKYRILNPTGKERLMEQADLLASSPAFTDSGSQQQVG